MFLGYEQGTMCPTVAIDYEQTPPLSTFVATTTSHYDPKSSL